MFLLNNYLILSFNSSCCFVHLIRTSRSVHSALHFLINYVQMFSPLRNKISDFKFFLFIRSGLNNLFREMMINSFHTHRFSPRVSDFLNEFQPLDQKCHTALRISNSIYAVGSRWWDENEDQLKWIFSTFSS